MKQNISLDYVKKFRNNIVEKCNSLAEKIKTGTGRDRYFCRVDSERMG